MSKNPFDQKYNHQRFTVLNDKRRGQAGGRPAHARERAQEIRRKTLLPQMQERGRVGGLKDRRFGSRLPQANDEGVQVERFKAERLRGLGKRAVRRSIFNLGNDDDDDDEVGLTHGGQAIDELEEEELMDEDFEENEVDDEYEQPSFGNFSDDEGEEEEGPARKKSKAEVMSEIIAKSKKHRVERQRAAQETAELIEKLDEDLATIRGALSKRDDESKSKPNSEFDEAVRMMTFDRRVQPADRTKTAEEVREEATKRRKEAQEAAAKRQVEGGSAEEEDGEFGEEEADFSHLTQLLEQFANSPQESYGRMREAAQGKEAVLLGKAIRAKLQELSTQEGATSLYGPRPSVPSLSVCLMLHAIGRIYSTGDRHHVIVTPAALYLGMLLQRMRLSTPKHLTYTLFLAQVALEYARPAKRFVPEVLNLLEHVLCLFAGKTGECLPRSLRLEKEVSGHQTFAEGPLGLADLTGAASLDRILGATLYLLSESAQLWAGQVAYPELFQPSLELLQGMEGTAKLISLLESLLRPARAKRIPLRLQQHKPIPLPLLTPALDQPRRDENLILKRSIKKEAKGARRELLRDNRFLADQQRIQKAEQSERYQSMLRKVHGTIANDGANISFGGDFKKKRKRN